MTKTHQAELSSNAPVAYAKKKEKKDFQAARCINQNAPDAGDKARLVLPQAKLARQARPVGTTDNTHRCTRANSDHL